MSLLLFFNQNSVRPFQKVDWSSTQSINVNQGFILSLPLEEEVYPFSQTQWSTTQSPIVNQGWFLTYLPEEVIQPFFKSDWPKTQELLNTQGYVLYLPLELLPVISTDFPFSQTSWSGTRSPELEISDQYHNDIQFYPVVVIQDIDARFKFLHSTMGRVGNLGGVS